MSLELENTGRGTVFRKTMSWFSGRLKSLKCLLGDNVLLSFAVFGLEIRVGDNRF